ncbi:MAG: ABC transporter permease, partial [Streptococcus infantarius]
MKLIWTYLKRYPKWLVLDVIGALTFVVVNLGLPTALARMIDQGVTVGNKDKVYFWALVMLVVIILGMIGRVILAYAAGKITTNMIKDMRNDMYDKLQQYSHQEYKQIGVSSLVTRMTSDAFILMQFAEQTLRMGVITPLMMISSVVMILVTSPTLAWIVAVAIPFLVLVVYYVATRTRPLSEKQQSTLDKMNQYVRENLTGLRVIRAFAREDFQEQRFGSKNDEYKD